MQCAKLSSSRVGVRAQNVRVVKAKAATQSKDGFAMMRDGVKVCIWTRIWTIWALLVTESLYFASIPCFPICK